MFLKVHGTVLTYIIAAINCCFLTMLFFFLLNFCFKQTSFLCYTETAEYKSLCPEDARKPKVLTLETPSLHENKHLLNKHKLLICLCDV